MNSFQITDELSLVLVEREGEKKVIVSAVGDTGESVEVELFAEEVALLKRLVTNLYGLIK